MISEKRLLQIAVAIACIVPISAGSYGIAIGTEFLGGGGSINLDSHVRYLSGLLLAIGVGFLSTVRDVEHHTARFQLLTSIVVMGGFARLAGLLHAMPDHSMLAALVMELLITPLLCLWQHRIAKMQ